MTFGDGIDKNTKRLDGLEPLVHEINKKKTNNEEFQRRVSLVERDIALFRDQVENFRLDNMATDKHLQTVLPINTITEVNKMFQAVFPRRRHKVPLHEYCVQRQMELKNRIDELRFVELDKKAYELVEAPSIDRKQSVDSSYIREGVNMYKQEKAAKSRGGGGKGPPSRK